MAQHTHEVYWHKLGDFFVVISKEYKLMFFCHVRLLKFVRSPLSNRTETSAAASNKEYRLYKLSSGKKAKHRNTNNDNSKSELWRGEDAVSRAATSD